MKSPGLLALACAIVVGAGGIAAAPAQAAEHNDRYERQNEWRREQQRILQQQRWRELHRYDSYHRRPDVYYSAPPLVYQPPGAALNFTFPFYNR